jgi:hypothetical protein
VKNRKFYWRNILKAFLISHSWLRIISAREANQQNFGLTLNEFRPNRTQFVQNLTKQICPFCPIKKLLCRAEPLWRKTLMPLFYQSLISCYSSKVNLRKCRTRPKCRIDQKLCLLNKIKYNIHSKKKIALLC